MTDDLGTPHLRFERRGLIGWCVIDRPHARNALTGAMYFGIRKAVELVNRDADLQALVITGVCDTFCPGGDLRMDEQERDSAKVRIDVSTLLGSDVLPFKAIRQSSAPIVSAVNGICQGGGLTIAMLSDIAVASNSAVFRGPELLRGIADTYYAQIMPAHIGIAMTRDLMFSGRRLSASEAVAHGLISRICAPNELHSAATEAAEQMLRAGPEARYQFKRIVNERYGPVDEMTFNASIAGLEAAEGMRSFAEKRSPDWVPDSLKAGRL